MTSTKRILAIDGGGIKGVFPAAFLASIEECLDGHAISDYFDLIVGTSTGGIIALGLGLGFSAKEIVQFYKDYGPDIFPSSVLGQIRPSVRQLFKSKYSHDQLKRALTELLQEKTLGHSSTRLVIPSFNVETGEVHVFKTRHHPCFTHDYKVRAVDVALATASAPVFYPAHRLGGEVPLVDGGIWANNPTGMAVAEAVGVLGWDLASLRVLSLGCTKPAYSANWARRKSVGLLYWAPNVTNLFMTAQSSASMGIATTMLGHAAVKRINPEAPPKRFGLDKSSEIDSLCGRGKTEGRKEFPHLQNMFFASLADPFTPFDL